MWKKVSKKYWKITAAAVFLSVAGFFYGVFGEKSGGVLLENGPETAEAKREPGTGNEEDVSSPESFAEAGPSHTDEPGYFVHICGEVNQPGVYELPAGSRVFEAVEAAGGFTEAAAPDSLNLAQKVSDGMKLVILSEKEAETLSGESFSGTAGESDGLININTASKEQLMTLTGIGESRADDIIRFREESGGFEKIEDIMKVPGIKNAGFQKIKDRITV